MDRMPSVCPAVCLTVGLQGSLAVGLCGDLADWLSDRLAARLYGWLACLAGGCLVACLYLGQAPWLHGWMVRLMDGERDGVLPDYLAVWLPC